jgi:hypothetical protein
MSADGARRRRWRFGFLRQLWLRVMGCLAPQGAGTSSRR